MFIKLAIPSNILSLCIVHSGISGSGHGAGALIVLFIMALVWLITITILIGYLIYEKNRIFNSKWDRVLLLFCTPVPLIAYVLILIS